MKIHRGQALVILLVFVAVAMVVSATAVVIMIIGSHGSAQLANSQAAWTTAESGGEDALLRLLRDPTYAGETLTIGTDTATISVTGTDPKIITSTGVSGEFSRRIKITAGFTNGVLIISSWQEVY